MWPSHPHELRQSACVVDMLKVKGHPKSVGFGSDHPHWRWLIWLSDNAGRIANQKDLDTIDNLASFTLQGWFKTVPGQTIRDFARLFDNASTPTVPKGGADLWGKNWQWRCLGSIRIGGVAEGRSLESTSH